MKLSLGCILCHLRWFSGDCSRYGIISDSFSVNFATFQFLWAAIRLQHELILPGVQANSLCVIVRVQIGAAAALTAYFGAISGRFHLNRIH